MADTAPEVPVEQQLAAADSSAARARDLSTEARRAETAASNAYDRARRVDPAGQATDFARHAWAEALRDMTDAIVAQEQARDELRALRQLAEVERDIGFREESCG